MIPSKRLSANLKNFKQNLDFVYNNTTLNKANQK